MQKAKEKYHNCGGKEKAAGYYQTNQDVIKQKANNKYKNLSKEQEGAKRKYSKYSYEKMKNKSSEIIKIS